MATKISKAYLDTLSDNTKAILVNFLNNGKDVYSLLGDIAKGADVDYRDIPERAQALSRIEKRGIPRKRRIEPHMHSKGYNSFYDGVNALTKNHEYTSHVLCKDLDAVGALEFPTPMKVSHFASIQNAFSDSGINCPTYASVLEKIKGAFLKEKSRIGIKKAIFGLKYHNDAENTEAEETVVDAVEGENSIALKKVRYEEPTSGNQYENLVKLLFDRISNQEPKDIKSNVSFSDKTEKYVANVCATMLVCKAINFGNVNAEKDIDEALLLEFVTSLNGLSQNGIIDFKKIISYAFGIAEIVIPALGYKAEDIIQKNIRLGTPLVDGAINIHEALVGAKKATKAITTCVEVEIVPELFDVVENPEKDKRPSVTMHSASVKRTNIDYALSKKIISALRTKISAPTTQKDLDKVAFLSGALFAFTDKIEFRNSKAPEYSRGLTAGKTIKEKFVDSPLDTLFAGEKEIPYDPSINYSIVGLQYVRDAVELLGYKISSKNDYGQAALKEIIAQYEKKTVDTIVR